MHALRHAGSLSKTRTEGFTLFAIQTENLTRQFRVPARDQKLWQRLITPRYETVSAVSGINMRVEEGAIVGYIGPNGAGKSTTIKMLLGILHPTQGQVEILGRNPYKERLANNREVGVVWGSRNALAWDIPVRDSFEKFRRIYGVNPVDFNQRLRLVEDYLDIGPLLHKNARHLSLGEKMRCNLANVMLHGPRLLYLDEPTIGLDVMIKHQVRRFLRHINREWGTTILLTTHDLSDIEDLCPRIVVIDKGQLILDEMLDKVRDRLGGGVRATFQFLPDATLDADLPTVITKEFPGVTARLEPGPRLVLQIPRSALNPITAVRWVVNRLEPTDLHLQEDAIDEVVKRIYTGSGLDVA